VAYRIGIAQGYAVRDGAAACDEAVRNAGLTMIAVACFATGVGVGGVGLEAAYAVTASPARRDVRGVNAPTTKTTSGMKAAATIKTASGTKATAAMQAATAANLETTAPAAMKATAPAAMKAAAPADMKAAAHAAMKAGATATMKAGAAATMKTTAAATMKAAATATVKTTATALARLGYEREPHDCASQDCSERQRDPFAAPRSHHIFLHLN
jgi:hypothetical protein